MSLAFHDGAFENRKLTLGMFWWLKVLRCCPLLLFWTLVQEGEAEYSISSMCNVLYKCPYGSEVYLTLPVTYDSSRLVRKDTSKEAGFLDSIGHYHF
jgi:hypothetical protein